MNIVTSLSGSSELSGSYAVGDVVVVMVRAVVKAEPHLVGTASGGEQHKMTLTISDMAEPKTKKDRNEMEELIANLSTATPPEQTSPMEFD